MFLPFFGVAMEPAKNSKLLNSEPNYFFTKPFLNTLEILGKIYDSLTQIVYPSQSITKESV